MPDLKITVLCGGVGPEREISLKSGAAVADALASVYDVVLTELNEPALPVDLDGDSIVFPALHGVFGEDGQLQALLEASGIPFCGSGSQASRICMDKAKTKKIVCELGFSVPEGLVFAGNDIPPADSLIDRLGSSIVVKPVDLGSSVGLHFTEHRSELGILLSQIDQGRWLAERRVCGRELTIGLLHGKPMGIVEIISQSGVYDYTAKYSGGSTQYVYPAEIGPELTRRIEDEATRIFAACQCRDFARIDFILDGETIYFLEVNTLPGLTETSLLPKSAHCSGYSFKALAEAMVAGALERMEAVE